MQLKSTTAIAALAIVAASGVVHAGALAGFTQENTSAILRAAGATDIKSTLVDNEPRLTFTMNNVTYVADLYGCHGAKGCETLHFVVAYEAKPTDTIEAINAFNTKYVYGKAALDKTEGVKSMRMINGRAGSSTEQVAAELEDFIAVTKILLAQMNQSAPTASYAPDAPAVAFGLSAQQGAMPSRRPPLPLNRR